MAMKNLKNFFSVSILILSILAGTGFVLLFTSCDSPMGLGKPIDFEPPRLILTEPKNSPIYVTEETVLRGTVTDNVAVKHVYLRDAVTMEPIAANVLIQELIDSNRTYCEYCQNLTKKDPNDKRIIPALAHAKITNGIWEMKLAFDESRNGEKLSVDIVAFDNMDNSDDTSIKTISIIIDTNPPLTEDIVIKRSDSREAFFEKQSELEALRVEPRGMEKVANVNRFQNGFFNILATISESETRINDTLRLNIYDAENGIDDILIQLEITSDSSLYSPKWLISETDILAAGEQLWPGYTAAYEAGTSYIYRVATEVHDRSFNVGVSHVTLEEEGYFLMSFNADEPKGILDPIVGSTVTRGGTIPVEFFDDDQLLWAYTGLLTYDQWHGTAQIASGVSLPGGGATEEQKLAFLQTRLLANQPVYNWRYDRYPGNTTEPIEELIGGRTLNERTIYLQAGNGETDYGQFFLFSLVADKKLKPHEGDGPRDTNRTRTKGRSWLIDVVDENAPLIVLDVENGCPEENTFPSPLTNGEYFTLKGYTLRENGNDQNGVIKLRMAWIPSRMEYGADSHIAAVQAALSADNYPTSISANPALAGVQYWDFNFATTSNGGISYTYNSDQNEQIGPNKFRNQPFARTFSVLGNVVTAGNPAQAVSSWKDFHYGCAPGGCIQDINENPICRENENKLFVIFAECNMGHQVYRQMRLLGNRTPPDLSVFDISGNILDSRIDDLSDPKIPNVQLPANGSGIPNTTYDNALRAFNIRDDLYSLFRNVSINASGQFIIEERQRAIPFQMYTWGTTLKYWARALPNGDLRVKAIRMRDITTDVEKSVGSNYRTNDNSLIFVEYYPDEAQRVFLFEAEDSLGNIARMQRTIAVTNAARLEKITTEKLNGTYGIGEIIELQADFSGQIRVELGTQGQRPLLNVRYPVKNPTTGVVTHVIDQLPAYIETPGDDITKATLFLKFRFVVPANAVNNTPLQTMYDGDSLGGDPAADKHTDRPLSLLQGTRIIDVNRDQHAFIPGYTIGNASMPNWITNSGSLQTGLGSAPGKTILLDGIRPVITAVSINAGKAAHSTNNYYFKDGDTIELTITADKPILNADTPVLQFTVRNLADSGDTVANNNTAFLYSRQDGTNSLVFSLPVTSIAQDGRISSISLVRSIITTTNANPATTTNQYIAAGSGALLSNNQVVKVTVGPKTFWLRVFTATSRTFRLYNSETDANGAGNGVFVGSGAIDIVQSERITDRVGNELINSDNLKTNSAVNAMNLYIKKVLPPMPVVTLANTTPALSVNLQSAAATYNHGVSMTINASPTGSGFGAWEDTIEYSLDGGLQWLTYSGTVTGIANGTHNIRARYKDRAGNEGYQRHRCTATTNANSTTCQTTRNYSCAGTIQINSEFPKLNAVTAVQPTGWFTANAGQNTLTFNLAFEDQVQVATSGNTTVTITLRNRNAVNSSDPVTGSSAILLNAATGQTGLRTSIQFNWQNISGKEMPDGLYVSDVVLTGLRDSFGNAGGSGTATISGTTPSAISINSCPNLVAGYRVDAIAPTISSRTPVSGETLTSTANGSSGSATYNRVITLTFNESVIKGVGTITVRPRGTYAIPAVFENDGYFLQSNENGTTSRATSSGQNRTYIPSLYDIYNNSALTAANRVALLRSTTAASQSASVTGATAPSSVEDTTTPSMSRLLINARTGRNTGPYILMTHGLISGPGYTGNYTQTGNTTDGTGANAPNPAGTFMVPDTVSKWVLDYQYGINQDVAAVNNIRAALTAAKFRWQEVDVVNSNVVISENIVTITLNEPLLHGLQWDVSYPVGTFTDMAGNNAAIEDSYWLWSNGVQTPVVRVNRRSYDGRTSEWHRSRGASNNYTFANPTNTTDANWGANTAVVSDATTDVGWGITNFNRIHYRVDCESPGAALTVGTHKGASDINATDANARGSASAAWTGSVLAANANATDINGAYAWDRAAENLPGTWVLNNIIRRSRTSGTQSYSVNTKSGLPEVRTYEGTYRGYRSYNRDYTLTDLEGITLASATLNSRGGYQNILTYEALEANKSYVAAQASLTRDGTGTIHGSSSKGYEGIFRTVIAFNFGTGLSENQLFVQGSNVKNGMPSVSGFPVRDAEETGDNRFIKMFFRNTTGNTQFYWVSTEIVCEWYLISWGGGGTHQNVGEANNYSTVGYGDLTYGYNVTRYGR